MRAAGGLRCACFGEGMRLTRFSFILRRCSASLPVSGFLIALDDPKLASCLPPPPSQCTSHCILLGLCVACRSNTVIPIAIAVSLAVVASDDFGADAQWCAACFSGGTVLAGFALCLGCFCCFCFVPLCCTLTLRCLLCSRSFQVRFDVSHAAARARHCTSVGARDFQCCSSQCVPTSQSAACERCRSGPKRSC